MSRTYGADKRERAGRQTREILMPYRSALVPAAVIGALTLLVGGAAAGAGFVKEAYQGEVYTVLAVALAATIPYPVLWTWFFLRAPQELWSRDQNAIAEMQGRLRPAILVTFKEEECVRGIGEGVVSPMANGSTFFGIHRTPLHYLVKCCNIFSVRVEDVECSVINVKRTNGVEENVFFDPVRISLASTGDAQATINIAPDSCRFFSVFRHATAYEPPLLNGLNIPFDYRMLFNKSGVYQIIVCAHGKNTTGHSTIIEFQLNVSPNQDRNGKAYAEYHIPWVRQRAANSLGDGADAKS